MGRDQPWHSPRPVDAAIVLVLAAAVAVTSIHGHEGVGGLLLAIGGLGAAARVVDLVVRSPLRLMPLRVQAWLGLGGGLLVGGTGVVLTLLFGNAEGWGGALVAVGSIGLFVSAVALRVAHQQQGVPPE